jgi:hypothetical protein
MKELKLHTALTHHLLSNTPKTQAYYVSTEQAVEAAFVPKDDSSSLLVQVALCLINPKNDVEKIPSDSSFHIYPTLKTFDSRLVNEEILSHMLSFLF